MTSDSSMLGAAQAAARAGAGILRRHGLRPPARWGDYEIEAKGTGDYVTGVDLESESAILEILATLAPGVPALSEESGGPDAAVRWVVDPLDGTTNFTRGLPEVAVSVALVEGGVPRLGVVAAPFLDLELAGERGRGVMLNGSPVPRRRRLDPARAVVATGLPFRHKERMTRYQPVLVGAFRAFEDIRRAGAASLDLAWTAAGCLDGFFELGLGAWDVAAGAAMVLEAGCVVTDWAGGEDWLHGGDLLAGPAEVHQELLRLAAHGGLKG